MGEAARLNGRTVPGPKKKHQKTPTFIHMYVCTVRRPEAIHSNHSQGRSLQRTTPPFMHERQMGDQAFGSNVSSPANSIAKFRQLQRQLVLSILRTVTCRASGNGWGRKTIERHWSLIKKAHYSRVFNRLGVLVAGNFGFFPSRYTEQISKYEIPGIPSSLYPLTTTLHCLFRQCLSLRQQRHGN